MAHEAPDGMTKPWMKKNSQESWIIRSKEGPLIKGQVVFKYDFYTRIIEAVTRLLIPSGFACLAQTERERNSRQNSLDTWYVCNFREKSPRYTNQRYLLAIYGSLDRLTTVACVSVVQSWQQVCSISVFHEKLKWSWTNDKSTQFMLNNECRTRWNTSFQCNGLLFISLKTGIVSLVSASVPLILWIEFTSICSFHSRAWNRQTMELKAETKTVSRLLTKLSNPLSIMYK